MIIIICPLTNVNYVARASTAVTNMEIQQNVSVDRSSRCFVKMDYGPMRNQLNPAMTSSHRSMWNPSRWSDFRVTMVVNLKKVSPIFLSMPHLWISSWVVLFFKDKLFFGSFDISISLFPLTVSCSFGIYLFGNLVLFLYFFQEVWQRQIFSRKHKVIWFALNACHVEN